MIICWLYVNIQLHTDKDWIEIMKELRTHMVPLLLVKYHFGPFIFNLDNKVPYLFNLDQLRPSL